MFGDQLLSTCDSFPRPPETHYKKTLQRVLLRTDGNILYSTGNSMHCGNLNGREVQKGGAVCMCMADSFCCAVEANTTL